MQEGLLGDPPSRNYLRQLECVLATPTFFLFLLRILSPNWPPPGPVPLLCDGPMDQLTPIIPCMAACKSRVVARLKSTARKSTSQTPFRITEDMIAMKMNFNYI